MDACPHLGVAGNVGDLAEDLGRTQRPEAVQSGHHLVEDDGNTAPPANLKWRKSGMGETT